MAEALTPERWARAQERCRMIGTFEAFARVGNAQPA
jgi:hypothetical protein